MSLSISSSKNQPWVLHKTCNNNNTHNNATLRVVPQTRPVLGSFYVRHSYFAAVRDAINFNVKVNLVQVGVGQSSRIGIPAVGRGFTFGLVTFQTEKIFGRRTRSGGLQGSFTWERKLDIIVRNVVSSIVSKRLWFLSIFSTIQGKLRGYV